MKKAVAFVAMLGACAAFAAEVARAPDGVYSDRSKLVTVDARVMIRIRQDFFTRATGCPLYIATLPSAEGVEVREKAAEIFTRWHMTEKRLPDEAILLVVFAAERRGEIVLGPTVPKEYEDALADLPPLRWDTSAAAGPAIDRLVFDLDARLEAPAVSLKQRRSYFIPPVPQSFVLDGDGRFSDGDRARLESDLAARAKSSRHPIVAVIDPPGLPLALGDFSGTDRDHWIDAAFGEWRRDRPELEDGAVLFAFTSSLAASIAYGKNVEGRLPKEVSLDLVRDISDGQIRANFDRALVRIADTLDLRFAGKKTLSVRSPVWAVLHPWRILAGPDEEVSLAFKIFSAGIVLWLVGWYLFFLITNPKIMLLQMAGFAFGSVIGGAVSSTVGEGAGESVGKFLGGLGSSGGGGASGSW